MKNERRYPARHILDDVGNRANIAFVTVCTRNRRRLLAHDEIHELLLRFWREGSHWLVGRYVVMPDHLHLFCAPAIRPVTNVRDWVAYWKSMTTRYWPHADQKPIWQREAWDRQLRHGDSYDAIWDYVRNNPVRHGLASRAEDWPYQGELHPLPWHEM